MKVVGSVLLTPYSSVASRRVTANDMARPMIMPVIASRIPWPSTVRLTRAGGARQRECEPKHPSIDSDVANVRKLVSDRNAQQPETRPGGEKPHNAASQREQQAFDEELPHQS